MKTTFDLRNTLRTTVGNTTITRADFEKHFHTTAETVVFSFGGWDGKSYDGETRTARVLHTDIEGFENARFVKVGKSVHMIDDNAHQIVEKATGTSHPGTSWLIDVARA